MGLGAPLALLALIALVLPAIAHLKRQKDLPSRTFPALRLLAQANAASRQQHRIKDRPLLFIRALVMVAIVLAAAAPFVWREGAFVDGQRSCLALIVDDSMSMESMLDDVQRNALRAVTALPADSQVTVIAAGYPARVLVPLTTDVRTAQIAIAGLHPSARRTDLAHAARLAASQLTAADADRRLLVLSDFAAHTSADEVDWPPAERAFLRLRADRSNTSIVDATLAADPTRPSGRSVRVRIEGPNGPCTIQLLDGHETVTETVATLVEGSAEVYLAVPSEAVHLAVALIRQNDAISADNRRELPPANSAVHLLIVDGDPAADELRFVSRALTAIPPGMGEVDVQRVDIDRLAQTDLRAIDVVLLADPNLGTSEQIRDFVENGGGLWVTAGPHLPRASLASVLPARIGPSEPVPEGTELRGPWPGLERTQTRRRMPLQAARDATVLGTWSDGEPALVVQGQVAVFGTALDDDWSTLPFQPGFVQFVHGQLTTLAPPHLTSATTEAGEPVSLPAGATVLGPNGEFEAIDGTFTHTEIAGLYRVQSQSQTLSFVVVPNSHESVLTPGPVPVSSDLTTSTQTRSQWPLGAWLFLVFGLLQLVEGFHRTRSRRALG